METKERLEAALNEARTLVLGGQIVLGFQFTAIFQRKFEELPPHVQMLNVVAIALIIFAMGLLLTPVPYHRLVARGNDTTDTRDFTTTMTTAAPLPFAMCIGLDIFIVHPTDLGIVTALIMGSVALYFWYGAEIVQRQHHPPPERKRATHGRTSIHEKIKTINTEARIILPGVQALLGFQFTAFLTPGFDRLPGTARDVHFAGLICLGLSAILLMAPAAYHRIAADGEDRADVDRFAARAVLTAMMFLAVGLAADLYLAIGVVMNWRGWEVPAAVVTTLTLWGLWFGYPWLVRWQRTS